MSEVRVKVSCNYRGFPITVEGEVNEVKQLFAVTETFEGLKSLVDSWHKVKALRLTRRHRKTVLHSETAMSYASKFLFSRGEAETE